MLGCTVLETPVDPEIKSQLDRLIQSHEAQPVGSGYIDIIVPRIRYRSLAQDLIQFGARVIAVSWWEYVASVSQPNSYGTGGPRSNFFEGWFAECSEVDEVSQLKGLDGQLQAIVELVESKNLGVWRDEEITFADTTSLTPAFWLSIEGLRKL